MPDKLGRLTALLIELEMELSTNEDLSEESKNTVTDAVEKIKSALTSQESQKSDSSESVTSVLNKQIEEFESHHPALTSILSRITDTLGQMGI